MEVAYDHVNEEILSPVAEDIPQNASSAPEKDLNTEVKEAYTAISSSPWGLKLGGFLSQVKKQGESYYEGARQEFTAVSTEASKGLSGLTKNLSLGTTNTASTATSTEPAAEGAKISLPADIAKEATALFQQFNPLKKRTPSDPANDQSQATGHVSKGSESIITRIQSQATARLRKIKAAEDAADEALERFGLGIKNFLRDAVTIAPPSLNADGTEKSTVLFESKDAEGRRVVHATRFDAQLHVIHTTVGSFVSDPESAEYKPWRESFSVDTKTADIAKDLDKYEELRRAMEKLVPEKVDYTDFWTRYYFLRHVIETEEQRRRELLQKTQAEEEEVKWDDDEEVEESGQKQADAGANAAAATESVLVQTVDEEALAEGDRTPTKKTGAAEEKSTAETLKPAESRKSNEHSVADSESSYDLVSGATSQGPGTPKEEKEAVPKKPKTVAEESDEDDWE